MDKKLSIVCITYNQENFIKQTLDSFLAQKTNFEFDIIISDDCSTDNTPKILKEYEQKFPNTFRIYYQETNLGSLKNYLFALSKAKTKYVLVNEGDDYFTNPNKLQKQVDFLEANPEYSICFHPVEIVYEEDKTKNTIYPSKKMINKGLNIDHLLIENFMQTNSVMYRWDFAEKNIQEIFPDNILPADWYLHLLHAKEGKIKMLKDVMSAYRKHIGGIWYDENEEGKNRSRKHGMQMLNFYNNVYKNITNYSNDYLNTIFLSNFTSVVHFYYTGENFDKLQEIKKLYPELLQTALNNSDSKYKRFKKYKKLFNNLLFATIIEAFIIFALLLFIFLT